MDNRNASFPLLPLDQPAGAPRGRHGGGWRAPRLVAPALAVLRRLVRAPGNSVAGGAVLSLSLKVASAGLTLLIFTLASRSMGPQRFGQLSMCFNALSFAAVLTVFGQDSLIIRSWSEHRANGAPGLVRGAYLHGWQVVAATTALAVIATAWVAARLGASPALIGAACAFLAGQTFTHYSSHSCRLVCHQLIADGNREFPWRLAVLAAALGFLAAKQALTLSAFFWAAAAGFACAVALQSIFIARQLPHDLRSAPIERRSRQWIAASVGLWLPAMLEAASQYAEVILIGLLLDPAAAGGYFVAMRFAAVFPMIATGLNAYVLNRVAGLHFQGRSADLARMLRSLMTVGTGLTVAVFVLIVVAGHWLLGFFGQRYLAEYPTLVVLSIGTAAVTLAGPTSMSLLTTGHEAIYLRTVLVAMLVRFGLMAVLVPNFGAFGAATAWTASAVPLACALVIACRRKLGVDPSAFGLLTLRAKRAANSE